MDSLLRYYLHQAGRYNNHSIGTIYAAPPFLQSGYGISGFFAGVWRVVRPVLWSGAKTLGRETLRTGGDILTAIARSTDEHPWDIISRRFKEKAQNLIVKFGDETASSRQETSSGKKCGQENEA